MYNTSTTGDQMRTLGNRELSRALPALRGDNPRTRDINVYQPLMMFTNVIDFITYAVLGRGPSPPPPLIDCLRYQHCLVSG